MKTIIKDTYKVTIFHEIEDSENDNIDVEVVFRDQTRYSATVFTLKNIQTLMEKYTKTGENNSGQYFWSSDLFILHSLTEDNILEAVAHLIQEDRLALAFQLLENDDDYDYWENKQL